MAVLMAVPLNKALHPNLHAAWDRKGQGVAPGLLPHMLIEKLPDRHHVRQHDVHIQHFQIALTVERDFDVLGIDLGVL